jgi:hypothetical protein
LVRSTPDPSACEVPKAELLDLQAPFAFAYAVGGTGNYDVLYLREDGTCDYRFMAKDSAGVLSPRQALFKLSNEDMLEVRKAVSENHIFDLSLEYDALVADGDNIFIECRLRGRHKSVRCYNHFPDAVVAVNDFVIGRLLAPHRAHARDASADRRSLFSSQEFVDFGKGIGISPPASLPKTKDKAG